MLKATVEIVTLSVAGLRSNLFATQIIIPHQVQAEFKVFNNSWHLLFISYEFVKGFLATTFLLPVFSNWNFHDVCQRFLYNQEKKFSWIRQKTKIFPIDPHYKICPLI